MVNVNANNGKIYIKIDNGYELTEIHDVYAPSPNNNEGIFWSSGTTRYENKSIISVLGYTPESSANKGVANGYAPLASDAKIDADHHESMFRSFIWFISGQEVERYDTMKSVIGYMLHSYKLFITADAYGRPSDGVAVSSTNTYYSKAWGAAGSTGQAFQMSWTGDPTGTFTLWWSTKANPSLGLTVHPDNIRAVLSDPEDIVRTEVLCQWVDTINPVINPSQWESCKAS